jgi:acetyltransferase-like isoleucine patch superfamily enzyme
LSIDEEGVMAQIKIYPNVTLEKDVYLGEFVIVGEPPRGKQPGELRTVIGSQAVIRSHSIIYAGNTIGDNFQTGHGVMIRENNQIGDNVSVGTHSIVEHHVTIGSGVRLHSNVFVPEYSVLEDGCWLGPNVVVTNAKYPRSPDVKETLKGAIIKRNAKIGANTTLLPGVTIGENALVGAGSVVVDDVPPGAVAVGNPARVVKRIEDLGVYSIEKSQ